MFSADEVFTFPIGSKVYHVDYADRFGTIVWDTHNDPPRPNEAMVMVEWTSVNHCVFRRWHYTSDLGKDE